MAAESPGQLIWQQRCKIKATLSSRILFSGRQRSYCGLAGRAHAATRPVPCIREADQLPHGRLHRVMTTTQEPSPDRLRPAAIESLIVTANFKFKQAAASLEFPDTRPVPPWALLESSCGREAMGDAMPCCGYEFAGLSDGQWIHFLVTQVSTLGNSMRI
ncbi:hypothetical protein CCMA1212_006443 [Trichoderma ghanense]|uniref:Uncharacterized protein n=1 Tax=Trichoderma ghanense TaxID=65468 RepID=A0ABY2H085_9HYPO